MIRQGKWELIVPISAGKLIVKVEKEQVMQFSQVQMRRELVVTAIVNVLISLFSNLFLFSFVK